MMLRIRRVSQILFLLLFFYFLYQARYPYTGFDLSDRFIQFDPLAIILASLTDKSLLGWSSFAQAGFTLLLTIILGRVFCGWVCPMGTSIDLAEMALYSGQKLKPSKKNLSGLKYGVLVALIISALFGFNFWHFLDPIPLVHRIYTLVFYPVVVSGCELFLKGFRPVFEKLNLETLEYLQLKAPVYGQLFLTLGIFASIIGLSALVPRFFCRNLCPLGALLGFCSRFSLLGKQISDSCTDCAICEKVCPTSAIVSESWKDREAECIKCFICQTKCPTKAISYSFRKNPARESKIALSRRRFIEAGLLGASMGLLGRQSADLKNRSSALIRPPGALPESEFLARCTRCGECIKVCPTRVIQSQGLEQGLVGAFAPRLKMRLSGCDQNCRDCGKVCPTKALRELELEEKKYAKLGTAEIIEARCLVYAWGKMCLVCDEICPYNAIVFKTINNKRVPVVIPSRCNGCGFCESACPVIGESAIIITTAGEIRLREGSYKETAQARGIDLSAQDQLENAEESEENKFR